MLPISSLAWWWPAGEGKAMRRGALAGDGLPADGGKGGDGLAHGCTMLRVRPMKSRRCFCNHCHISETLCVVLEIIYLAPKWCTHSIMISAAAESFKWAL